MVLVKTTNLVKRYEEVLALDNVCFDINEGDIVGLLGPNGAGKSTLISCLTSILPYDSGEVSIFGKKMKTNAYDIKKDIGIVPQELSFYPNLSAYKNVAFFASLYGYKGEQLKSNVKRALEFVGLWDKRNQKAKQYSGGMKRRLNIAIAIVHEPKLIIMDEPTVGIDPQSRTHILDSISALNQEGATIIYTSHYMEEVERVCNHIHVMDKGRIIASGTKDELKNQVSKEKTLELVVENISFTLSEGIKSLPSVNEVFVDGRRMMIITKEKSVEPILDCVKRNEGIIESFTMKQCTLEDVFFSLTGRTLRD